jgi:LacI family transcriptional regulator
MTVTIKKIAQDLNLAVSTVSKALSDSYEISTETKKRVIEYAAQLDYIPNAYASSLKRRKTGNIALVLPEVADSFFSIAINGVESVAQKMGYHVLIYLTHEDQEKEQFILRDFRSGRVDGVLISASCGSQNLTPVYEQCFKELPLVFFDRVCHGIATAKIVTDDYHSGYKATEHLIEKGCKNIVYLGMEGNLEIINERFEGYKAAIENAGREGDSNPINFFNHSEADSLVRLKALLGAEKRPDGIVCSVEKLATLSYLACHELEISIPDDVKVIAFSSLQIAPLLDPPLTTITQPAFEMGREAANVLFKILDKKKFDLKKEVIVLPSTLVERGSTGVGP